MNQTSSDTAEPWELGPEIGSGAIATVLRVQDPRSKATYAAKVLHPRHERDAGARARFEREAELASALRHPNLVAVYGVHTISNRTALLMELVEGPTLAGHIAARGPLPPEMFIAVARGIAAGLAYAHARGVIHRDLKPANILLTDDDSPAPKIADFGMARAASFANADRRALTVLGTPPYMAPECLDPLAVDPRTDLYALGCILFEMATSAPPYGGATPYAVLESHRTASIPSLPEPYGAQLDALTRRLLAKAPGERPQSAAAVVDALDRIAGAHTALVPADSSLVTTDDIAEGRCASCGAEVHIELRLCFRCGMVQVFWEPGPYSTFVIGPGRISHKFASELRDKLVRWIRSNAAVGLDPTELERRIPRLAFPLAVGVSEMSGRTLVDSLRHLGIAAELRRGGNSAHEGARAVASALSRRGMTLAGAICAAPMVANPIFGAILTIPGILVALPVVLLLARRSAFRPALQASGTTVRPTLPPAMQGRLDQLYGLVAHITEARHREALRAVVHRAVDLTRALPPAARHDVDEEMGHAINLAAVATQRMDALDREMSRADFDPATPEHRALMRERDMWSARLLDLTATLDALAARRAAAATKLDDADEAELVASLRQTVESLEEVQNL